MSLQLGGDDYVLLHLIGQRLWQLARGADPLAACGCPHLAVPIPSVRGVRSSQTKSADAYVIDRVVGKGYESQVTVEGKAVYQTVPDR